MFVGLYNGLIYNCLKKEIVIFISQKKDKIWKKRKEKKKKNKKYK